MARQENLFNCPMCGRPVEVPSRYAGKDFVHSICGSTLRMAVPREGEPGEGEPDIELVSTPEPAEQVTVDLEAIRKSESRGLFLPRHLRDSSPPGAGAGVGQSSLVRLSAGESPGKASARSTKALSNPAKAAASRLREVRLTRDRSKSSRLRARFRRTVEDLSGDIHRGEEESSAGQAAGKFRPPGKKILPVSSTGGNGDVASGKMNDARKLVIVVSALMVLAAVMFMMVSFLPGG